MLIKCRQVAADSFSGPSDVLLQIETSDGTEEVMVYKDSLKDGRLEVGKILGARDGYKLVELPREAASGKWRVWVPAKDVMETA